MNKEKTEKNNSLLDFDKEQKMRDLNYLKGNIQSYLDEIDNIPTPPPDLLPGLNLEMTSHDYERDLELIKEETKETLECISSLYLDDKTMAEKNISNIIRNDSETIGNIKFSIECAKRGLINCMKQIDAGMNDPENHIAVGNYQKEIRDSNKMVYDLLTKMKTFYKELRVELKQDEINTAGMTSFHPTSKKPADGLFIFDPKQIDDIFEEHKKNPTLLDNPDTSGYGINNGTSGNGN